LYLLEYNIIQLIDISEEHITSNFRVEDSAKQETNVKHPECTATLMEIDAIYSSETSVGFCRITWHYTPENRTLFTATAMRTSNPTDLISIY
jgi:hypothetical protein